MQGYQLIVAFFCIFVLASSDQDLHPFLYFSSNDVISLKQQAKTTHREIFDRIKLASSEIKQKRSVYVPPRDWSSFSSEWNEIYGNNLAALVMYCVLEDSDEEAREIAFEIMDAFTSLPNWRVLESWRDDVPVAHSLVGMATAFDFLYHYLDSERRGQVLTNITAVSREIYNSGRFINVYIHNHAPTIAVALLTSALVVERQKNVEAREWKEKANQNLNRTMFLLSDVQDGSINELKESVMVPTPQGLSRSTFTWR